MSEESSSRAQNLQVVDIQQSEVTYADWIVSAGLFNGVANLDIGAIDHTMRAKDDDLARIIVTSRLRFSAEFAARLYNCLGLMLGKPGHGEMSPPQPVPPRGLMN